MGLTEPTIKLTAAQIAFFHREGYLAIPEITTREEIAWMRVLYDRCFAARVGRAEGDQFDLAGPDEDDTEAALPQILGLSKYESELQHCLYRLNAMAMATQLLGSETRFTGDHAILKPALYGAPTPWHQDEAYWGSDFEYNALSVWMPLQEADLENGCMQFIPGSHLWEVQPHHCIDNDPRIHGLEIDTVDSSRAEACPLPPGGATFHLSRTLHYTAPNRSAQPRRAYILTFGTPPKRRAVPRDFYWNTRKQTAREARARAAQAVKPTL
jgi:ectoine hydroxylase-related dioxygenase (phytanoyl-CoA dioxygenase family)